MAEKCENGSSLPAFERIEHRRKAMFGRLVPPNRLRMPLARDVPDLPQDRFTFDVEALRDQSGSDSTSELIKETTFLVLKDDLKIETCFSSHI